MTGEEAILHVLGPERYGRIRGVGFGISPTVYQYIQPMVEDRKKFVADVMEQADKRVKLMVEQMLEEKFQVSFILILYLYAFKHIKDIINFFISKCI